jgi:hypothetical protein
MRLLPETVMQKGSFVRFRGTEKTRELAILYLLEIRTLGESQDTLVPSGRDIGAQVTHFNIFFRVVLNLLIVRAYVLNSEQLLHRQKACPCLPCYGGQ